MENSYNILGNFENLNSVNIFKKLTLVPPTEKPTITEGALSIPEDNLDSLSDLEKMVCSKSRKNGISSPKKRKGLGLINTSELVESSKKESNDGNGENQNVSDICVEQIESNVARRTRSSRERASLDKPQSSTGCTSSTKNTTKHKKTTKGPSKKSTTALDESRLNEEHNSNNSRPKRGRKRTTNASNYTNASNASNATNASAIDIIEVGSNEQASSELNSTNTRTTQGRRLRSGRSRDVMRARRDYIAERAARCTTVDFVDLINSPIPRITGVIDVSLDSDEEENVSKSGKTMTASALETSFDEENPEMSVKIIWQGSPEFFSLRKYQKFETIFERLAQREMTSKDKIFLNMDNRIINPNDTPASINYKIFQFIYGRVMVDSIFTNSNAVGKPKRDPNLLTLKVQSDKWKHPLMLQLYKTDKFKKLIIKCAEELQMSYENIRLSFDGEHLQYDQTPNDLEFEGGEVLEIHFKNKV